MKWKPKLASTRTSDAQVDCHSQDPRCKNHQGVANLKRRPNITNTTKRLSIWIYIHKCSLIYYRDMCKGEDRSRDLCRGQCRRHLFLLIIWYRYWGIVVPQIPFWGRLYPSSWRKRQKAARFSLKSDSQYWDIWIMKKVFCPPPTTWPIGMYSIAFTLSHKGTFRNDLFVSLPVIIKRGGRQKF